MNDSYTTGVTAKDLATPRTSIVDEFEFAVTDLEHVSAELWGRLHPVLTNYVQHPEATADASKAAAVSPAREKLHRLHALSASFRELVDRLEV